MIACLRSTRMMPADPTRPVFVELRRHHDTKAIAGNTQFVVTQRMPAERIMINKRFGTVAEARRYWKEVVARLEDQGLRRDDFLIAGFHEED